jgi:hypothetical protein
VVSFLLYNIKDRLRAVYFILSRFELEFIQPDKRCIRETVTKRLQDAPK